MRTIKWVFCRVAAVVLASLLTLDTLFAEGDLSFIASRTFVAGSRSLSAVGVGDFNGDGQPDLAVTRADSATVSILLGNGDGTFQPAQAFDSGGTSVPSVAVGDFNWDGQLDLAVANSSGAVSILLGKGNGSFQPPRVVGVGISPRSVIVRDFNGDGLQDLAVTNGGSASVSILIGNGDGSFQPRQDVAVGNGPASLVASDFNGDGPLDLVVAYGNPTTVGGSAIVSIVLGNGDGTFRSEPYLPTGPRPQAVAVGDFNGDGRQDLAVAHLVSLPGTTTGSVAILLGNGDGTFQLAQQVEVRRFPYSVAVGDFNADGHPDLAVANFGSSAPEAAIVSILLGNGDGTFGPAQDFGPVRRATSVAVGDFDGDGRLDLAVTHGGSSSPEDAIVSILLGNGDGTFQPAQDFATGSSPQAVVVGDFNGDGQLDLAVANSYAGTVSILLGNGDGTFQTAQDFATGTDTCVPDGSCGPAAIAVGDFDRDGRLDLAVANGLFTAASALVSVLLGNGDGTFQPTQRWGTGGRASSIVVSDFNGDGHPDLVLGNVGGTTASVLLGNGDGVFQPEQDFGALGVSSVSSVVVGDFNGDTRPDVAVADNAGVSILMNDTLLRSIRRRGPFPSSPMNRSGEVAGISLPRWFAAAPGVVSSIGHGRRNQKTPFVRHQK